MAISSHIKPAHNYVPEYQQSGIPFNQTKTLLSVDNNYQIDINLQKVNFNSDEGIEKFKISFDRVTRWITVQNHTENGEEIRLYFNKDAAKTTFDEDVNNNDISDTSYYLIDSGVMTKRLEVKCKEIYLVSRTKNNANIRVSVLAGLTNIRSEDFPDQTPGNGFTGVKN